MARGRFEKKKNKLPLLIILVIVLFSIAAAYFIKSREQGPGESTASVPSTTTAPQPTTTAPPPTTTAEPTTETTVVTEPFVVSKASIGVTGDVLIHSPVYNAAYRGNGEYDFNDIFTYISEYYERYDFMVANLEVTLSGANRGYSGYPTFNCPDAIVDALKNAGVDMLLNANNHTYDHGNFGFLRTQEVLIEKEMPYLGTRLSEDVPPYIVQDINGIQVGMVCYTYETGRTSEGRKLLNGIPVSKEDTKLVNSFNYNNLDAFYEELELILSDMYADGADATMVYIHWGDEYQLFANDYQKKIAKDLCNMGVDIIVGGHPHVIQPFETLTSEDGHQTYCIYSVGNAISNQRRTNISASPNGHVEDGMIFGVEFEMWNDGSVNISGISILPTWVNKEWRSSGNMYRIIPLDTEVEVWDCYDVSDPAYTYGSYKRTMAIIGEGINACRESFSLAPMPTVHKAQ